MEMQTRWGEEVRVVGSRPELGSWDPAHGVPLQTSGETYPMWSAEIDLDLTSFYEICQTQVYLCGPHRISLFYYKFVICRPFGTSWEQRDNRQFLVFQPSALPVGLKVQEPRAHPPAMTRRGSVLPVECVQQLPTLLSTAVSPPSFPKEARRH